VQTITYEDLVNAADDEKTKVSDGSEAPPVGWYS
jgi:hypothetical protein